MTLSHLERNFTDGRNYWFRLSLYFDTSDFISRIQVDCFHHVSYARAQFRGTVCKAPTTAGVGGMLISIYSGSIGSARRRALGGDKVKDMGVTGDNGIRAAWKNFSGRKQERQAVTTDTRIDLS